MNFWIPAIVHAFQDLFPHCCTDNSRENSIYTDSVRSCMFCCGLHQACYSCLGCAVSLEHSHTVSACNRGYKDHVSALICFQMCQTMFDHMYGSHYIDIEQSLNLFCSCMHHILKGNYACCIYDHIDLSAAKCCCVSDQLLNVFFHSYITFCKAALYAKCLDLFYSSKALIFFTVCNIYVCATSCMAGEVEPGTAMLMADNGFLNFCEEELTACLQPQIAGRPDARQRVEGAARRLKELGEKAERHGGTHMGAVWILPVMGGKGWSRE